MSDQLKSVGQLALKKANDDLKTLSGVVEKHGSNTDAATIEDLMNIIETQAAREKLLNLLISEASDELTSRSERIKELEDWNAAMVEKAASGGTLDGYREMATKIAELEAELDNLRPEW